MGCETCNKHEEKNAVNPYFSAGEALDHFARIIKWLIIALVLSIALLAASNGYLLYQWSQYDYERSQSQEVTVDGKDGVASYVGGDNNERVTNNGLCSGENDTDADQNP